MEQHESHCCVLRNDLYISFSAEYIFAHQSSLRDYTRTRTHKFNSFFPLLKNLQSRTVISVFGVVFFDLRLRLQLKFGFLFLFSARRFCWIFRVSFHAVRVHAGARVLTSSRTPSHQSGKKRTKIGLRWTLNSEHSDEQKKRASPITAKEYKTD